MFVACLPFFSFSFYIFFSTRRAQVLWISLCAGEEKEKERIRASQNVVNAPEAIATSTGCFRIHILWYPLLSLSLFKKRENKPKEIETFWKQKKKWIILFKTKTRKKDLYRIRRRKKCKERSREGRKRTKKAGNLESPTSHAISPWKKKGEGKQQQPTTAINNKEEREEGKKKSEKKRAEPPSPIPGRFCLDRF